MTGDEDIQRIHTGWVDDGEYDPEIGHPWEMYLDGRLTWEELPPEWQEKAYQAGLAERTSTSASAEQPGRESPDVVLALPDMTTASDDEIDAWAASVWHGAAEGLRKPGLSRGQEDAS